MNHFIQRHFLFLLRRDPLIRIVKKFNDRSSADKGYILKVFVLLILTFFAMGTLSSATVIPSKSSSSQIKKKGAAKSVKIKKSASSKKKVTAPQKYKVRTGDSFYSIAKRHGMKLADLQRLNGIKGDRLKPGQIILISGTGKSRNSTTVNEVHADSRKVPTLISLPDDDGTYADALPEAGVEPIARTYLSIPYRYGAQSRKSTDCSGFVQQVFREFDVSLPRTAREQYRVGLTVEQSNLSSGDLLFFRTRSRKKYPTHVGIYLGNGKMIHASSRQHKVVISDVNHPYYVKRYVGAKRPATFLPGEIDLEMLARQVTGLDYDTTMGQMIVNDVGEETDVPPIVQASLASETCVVTGAESDDPDDAAEDGSDDIDNEVEPEADAVIPAPTPIQK